MSKHLWILFLLTTASALGMSDQRGLHPSLYVNLNPEKLSAAQIAILNEHHTIMQPLLLTARNRMILELGLAHNVKPRPSWFGIHIQIFNEYIEHFARASIEDFLRDEIAIQLRNFLIHGPLQPQTQELLGIIHEYQSGSITQEQHHARIRNLIYELAHIPRQ